jgi:hypothetical protein
MYEAIDDSLASFDSITDFASYTDWFNNSLIPVLYDPTDEHLYLLTDRVLVRQIRVPSEACFNPEGVPFLREEVPVCYPRFTLLSEWHPRSDLPHAGKPILATDYATYDSRGETIVLDRNITEALETLSKIDFDTWLDWTVQAVIVEFALYSPNLQLFSMCAIVGEFTNVGVFKGSHECAIVSPSELYHSYSWSAILLYLFFIGFFVEEVWELLLIAAKLRPASASEENEAAEKCQCCEGNDKSPPYFCSGCCYCNADATEPEPCCCSIPCWNYVNDLWNILDMFMILTGFVGLSVHNVAAAKLTTFTIEELWDVVEIEQVSHVFISICVVIAFFRFLHFLIPWEYIGVLVITVFKMMDAIVRFVILFIFIALGFAAAFHMLYDNSQTYSNFGDASLTTGIGIFSGYDVPDYTNVLQFPSASAGYAFQVGCVIIGVVLLLNFLIAMMSTIYEAKRENSTEEYRWLMTRELTQLKLSQWPVPFNIIQAPFACIACCAIMCDCEPRDEPLPEPARDDNVKQDLYANMTVSYFRETLSEKDYKKKQQFDTFEDNDHQ